MLIDDETAQLFEGDPFSDISILERPDDSLAVIMKQGVIVKGALRRDTQLTPESVA